MLRRRPFPGGAVPAACRRRSALAAWLLRTVADPLLRANRIRISPIRFSLEAGETAGSWARQLGLCHTPAAVGEQLGLRAQHRGMNFADQEPCWEGA
jgi:hypothetical protein